MRYMGGKSRIAKDISYIINLNLEGRVYIEPFVGSCYIMSRIYSPERFGYDLHPELIAMWQAVQGGWIPPQHITEEQYQTAMDGGYDDDLPLKAFILFGVSYGGKYRGGYARNHDDRDSARESSNAIFRKSFSLKNVRFDVSDYYNVPVPDGSVVYCDPPYIGGTGYKGLPPFDHDRFYGRVREWTDSAHLIFISETTAPDDFVSIWSKLRNQEMVNGMEGKDATDHTQIMENLFVHESQLERVSIRRQLTLGLFA